MEMGPYARTLGIAAEKADEGGVFRMKYSSELLGTTKLHGGTIAALLKAAALSEVMNQRQPGERPTLTSMTIRFLRGGRPEDAFARAVVTRKGNRVVNIDVAAWHDDPSRPIASAQASFVLSRNGGGDRDD